MGPWRPEKPTRLAARGARRGAKLCHGLRHWHAVGVLHGHSGRRHESSTCGVRLECWHGAAPRIKVVARKSAVGLRLEPFSRQDDLALYLAPCEVSR